MSATKIRKAKTSHNGLRKDEQYLGVMFGQPAVGVARIAPDGHFLVVNPALCQMLGYSKSELLRKTHEEISHSDDRADAAAAVKKNVTGEEPSYSIEKRYLRRGGSPLWVTETSSAVADGAGSLLYRVCLVQVHQRKMAEEHFRSALEAATNGMVMVNQKSKIVLVNSHTEELFGYSREELLGKSIEVLLANPFEKSHRDFPTELISQLEGRPVGTKWDMYGRRRDGELFPLELGLNPVHTLKGTWILYSIMEMSERRWADENLRQATLTIPIVGIDSIARDTASSKRAASIGASRAG